MSVSRKSSFQEQSIERPAKIRATYPIISNQGAQKGSQEPNNRDLVKEQSVKELLKICYDQIDYSFENFPVPSIYDNHSYFDNSIITETYVDNEELKIHLHVLLRILTEDDYCTNYIDRVFKNYKNMEGRYKYLVDISSYGCKNSKCISVIYNSLSWVNTKRVLDNIDIDEPEYTDVDVPLTSKQMKGELRSQLLNIKPMTENIRKIIITMPFSESTYVPTSSSNRLTSSSQKPNEYATKERRRLNTLKPLPNIVPSISQHLSQVGGKARKTQKTKVIFGKERCIYKKSGDQKQYVKYKGDLITVKEYKYIIKNK
jgi:hypothetical protein